MGIIELKDLKKVYGGETVALNKINYSFPSKGLVSILGSSGSGKTTLLNVLGTLDNDFLGGFFLFGKDVSKMNHREILEQRKNKIGYVFQNYYLISDLRVIDNVMLPLIITGVSFKDAKIRANELLNKLGLNKFIQAYPGELSGGMKQRVAIARAIINDKPILLCDEPTAYLDTMNTNVVMSLLKDIAKNRLVIFVSHNKELVYDNSDYIVTITDGEIKDINKEVNNKDYVLEETSYKNAKTLSVMKLILNNKSDRNKINLFSTISSLIILTLLFIIFNDRYIVEKLIKTLIVKDEGMYYELIEGSINFISGSLLVFIFTLVIIEFNYSYLSHDKNIEGEIGILKSLGVNRAVIILSRVSNRVITISKLYFKFLLSFLVVLIVINGGISIDNIVSGEYVLFIKNIFDITIEVIKNFIMIESNSLVYKFSIINALFLGSIFILINALLPLPFLIKITNKKVISMVKVND